MLKLVISAAVFFLLMLLETVFPLFAERKNRLRHVGRNTAIMLFNNLIVFALLSVATAFVFEWIQRHQLGLFNRLPLPAGLRLLFVFILFDLWMYIWHWMNHRSAVLWRFHSMHHSDTDMDASTAFRFHPGEIVISTILRWGVFSLLGMTIVDLLLYETILMPLILFVHSNFYLNERVDKILRPILITPWMHWVHHSRRYDESNSNFGSIFSWWDRLFKTFRLRSDPTAIQYGLDDRRSPSRQTVIGMLKTPFVKPHDP